MRSRHRRRIIRNRTDMQSLQSSRSRPCCGRTTASSIRRLRTRCRNGETARDPMGSRQPKCSTEDDNVVRFQSCPRRWHRSITQPHKRAAKTQPSAKRSTSIKQHDRSSRLIRVNVSGYKTPNPNAGPTKASSPKPLAGDTPSSWKGVESGYETESTSVHKSKLDGRPRMT